MIEQVLFISNPVTGLFVLAGALLNSRFLFLMGTVAMMSATAFAMALKLDKGAIQAGVFGFNGYLVGTGMGLFQEGWSYSWSEDDHWNILLVSMHLVL